MRRRGVGGSDPGPLPALTMAKACPMLFLGGLSSRDFRPSALPSPPRRAEAGRSESRPAVISLYDELVEKLAKEPRLTRPAGARYDLGLLLFAARDDIRSLWVAAEALLRADRLAGLEQRAEDEALAEAVGKLAQLFGEREAP